MKITVTGSLGNVSHILTRKLVADGHTVKLITSSTQRVASITQMGATALVGSIGDAEFIQSAFTGSDAVYLMIPPDPQATDVKKIHKENWRTVRRRGEGCRNKICGQFKQYRRGA